MVLSLTEEVEVYDLYHLGLGDLLVSRAEEVVIDGHQNLFFLKGAVAVKVVS